ncbi:hypothetical protein AOLI_G00148070 [Acnodon oligacanthus]
MGQKLDTGRPCSCSSRPIVLQWRTDGSPGISEQQTEEPGFNYSSRTAEQRRWSGRSVSKSRESPWALQSIISRLTVEETQPPATAQLDPADLLHTYTTNNYSSTEPSLSMKLH